eukprot:m51a1_g6401 hypothetical protein (95) ;mRNA; r:231745-232447
MENHAASGFMHKKGRFIHNWKKRWFSVTEFNVSVDKQENIRVFLRTPKRVWQFYYDDQKTAQYWVHKLEQIVPEARKSVGKKVVIDNVLKHVFN